MPQYDLNLRDYLRIFHKRKLAIIAIFIIVTASSVIYISRQPVFYTASATVKIEERKTIAGLLTEWIVYTPADIMESQAKIIKGYPIIKKVALRLGIIDRNSSQAEANELISRLQGSIETETIGHTNIIRITTTTDSPKQAMILANTVTEVYVEENLLEKTKQARHARQFIEEQLFSLDSRLEQAEKQLKGFGDGVKNIRLAPVIQKKLIELEFEVGALLHKYTDKHPRVIQVKKQIRDLEMQSEGFSGQELEYARLTREVEVNQKLYAMFKEKLEEARISEAEKVSDISIVDPALMPSASVAPNKNTGILIGGMMGLILGVAFAFVAETLDTSIGTIEDVESVVKLPVLGVVPSIEERYGKKQGFFSGLKEKLLHRCYKKSEEEERFVRLVAHYKPKSLAAEAFRNIRTNLKPGLCKTVLITSSGPREGKTTVMSNLGMVIAQAGLKTLLVSSDLRRPSVAKTFGLKREPGFNELITGAVNLEQALRNIADIMLGEMQFEEIVNKAPGIDNIWILPSGTLPFNPSEILESKELTALIEEFKRRFDVILFDSPPVLPVTDASLLAPRLDCVVIVYEIGRTSRDALLRTKVQIESVGGKVSGIILNHTQPQTEAITSYPYYSQYKYRYSADDETKREKEERRQL